MSESSRCEIDGIPCHIVDRGGPLIAGLIFRVGTADEELTTHGLSHLVEHLAMFETAATHLMANGATTATDTQFYVRGEPEEIVRFFAMVTRSLRSLPLERLEAETRILRTEGSRRGAGPYTAAIANRFGASGYGLFAYPELAFYSPRPDAVQGWADRWFTVDNVVMWATRPLPADLKLDLGRGRRERPPEPRPLPWRFPAYFRGGGDVLAISSLAARTDATTLAMRVLDERARQRLRYADANSYSVQGGFEPWTNDYGHALLVADTLPDHAGEVRDGLLGELGRLAIEPPSVEELATEIEQCDRMWGMADASANLAAGDAKDELIGRRSRSCQEAVGDLRDVKPEYVMNAASRLLANSIVQLPPGVDIRDHRFTMIPPGSDSVVNGRQYSRSAVLDESGRSQRFVIGPEGLSFVGKDGQLTVRGADVVAVQRWTDGARTVWGRDGLRVFVHPGEWNGGAEAIATIDAAVPAHLVVETGLSAGSTYLAKVEERTQAQTQAQRVRPPFARGLLRKSR